MNVWESKSREQLMDAAAGVIEAAFPDELLEQLDVDESKRASVRDLVAELRNRAQYVPADASMVYMRRTS